MPRANRLQRPRDFTLCTHDHRGPACWRHTPDISTYHILHRRYARGFIMATHAHGCHGPGSFSLSMVERLSRSSDRSTACTWCAGRRITSVDRRRYRRTAGRIRAKVQAAKGPRFCQVWSQVRVGYVDGGETLDANDTYTQERCDDVESKSRG